MAARRRSDLQVLDPCVAEFRRLLHVEAVAADVNFEVVWGEFGLWELVGVSHFFVVGLLVRQHLLVLLRMVLLDSRDADVSEALSQRAHRLHAVLVDASLVSCEHRCRVMVLNGVLCGLELLVLDEFLVPL